MPASQAQLRANKRYKHKHRMQTRFNMHKSECKGYILKWCKNLGQLKQVEHWIDLAKKNLK